MKIIKSIVSKDGKTTKYLQKTEGDQVIETSYFDVDEHNICISSQIGCQMGCIFCATAKPIDSLNSNFIRNLTTKEIVHQVKNVLALIPKKSLGSKRILFCFMGMGEPFLNYKNVVKSIKILSKEFPNSRTTICTLGINPPLIKKLAHENINSMLKLHLSLHAPNDSLRKKILPQAQKIKPALEALKYFSLIRKVPAKVNYVLIKGVNDSMKQAKELANLLESYPFVVKLSVLNLNDFNKLKPANEKKFRTFEKILNAKKVKTCRFFPDGTDIQSSCGQMKRSFYKNKYMCS